MIIPAIRGYIGTTVYYIANMTFKDVARLVNRRNSDELYKSRPLREALQRSLTDNYIKIKEYILNHKDHFFNAMVLAVYGGNPMWEEVRYEIGNTIYENVGLLKLDGEEQIFPIDGQHRLEGIKRALQESDKYANDTIPIILIGHECSPEGMAKSRRIFSILNRYAKPVRKGDIIALDEDDIVAIVTRELLETYPLFSENRIKVSNSKSIPLSDKVSFTTLMTLYDCHDELLKVFIYKNEHKVLSSDKLNDFKRTRPQDGIIESYETFVVSFWDSMRANFDELNRYIQDNSETPASTYRPQGEGGNLLFRPVGLYPLVMSICKVLMQSTMSAEEVIAKFAKIINTDVSSWEAILWDNISKKMVMRNRSLLYYLLIEMFDSHILNEKEKGKMIDRYALIFNMNRAQAEEAIKSKYEYLGTSI